MSSVTLTLLGRERSVSGGGFATWDGEGIGLCLDPGSPRRAAASVVLDLADYAAPTPTELVETLAALLEQMHVRPQAPVYIGCRAGVGRTGTFIAALACLAGHADPVAWTRRHFRPHSVETLAQEQAVANLDPGSVWRAFRARIGTTPPPVALYYYPANASTFVHMLLRELGIPFELRLVDRRENAQKSPEYLRLNPAGLIPVLIDGDLVLTETAAIALHLVDRHPECGLAPPVGTVARAHFYKWMVHLTNTPQAEILVRAYPERHVSDPALAPDVRATALRRIDGMFARIDTALGEGPFVLGARFSAADLFLMMLINWTAKHPNPAAALPNLGPFMARIMARASVRAALAVEGQA